MRFIVIILLISLFAACSEQEVEVADNYSKCKYKIGETVIYKNETIFTIGIIDTNYNCCCMYGSLDNPFQHYSELHLEQVSHIYTVASHVEAKVRGSLHDGYRLEEVEHGVTKFWYPKNNYGEPVYVGDTVVFYGDGDFEVFELN